MIAIKKRGRIKHVIQTVVWTKTSEQRPTEAGWYRIDQGGCTTKAQLSLTEDICVDWPNYTNAAIWPDGTPLTKTELSALLSTQRTIFSCQTDSWKNPKWIIYEGQYEPIYWTKEDNDGETEVGPSFFAEEELIPVMSIFRCIKTIAKYITSPTAIRWAA